MRGRGMFLAWASSRTIRYSAGYSASVTGLDLVVAMAILSEYQYMAKLKMKAMPNATMTPFEPPINPPISTNSPPRAAIRIQVFALFTLVPSSWAPWGLESHCRAAPRIERPDAPPPRIHDAALTLLSSHPSMGMNGVLPFHLGGGGHGHVPSGAAPRRSRRRDRHGGG